MIVSFYFSMTTTPSPREQQLSSSILERNSSILEIRTVTLVFLNTLSFHVGSNQPSVVPVPPAETPHLSLCRNHGCEGYIELVPRVS